MRIVVTLSVTYGPHISELNSIAHERLVACVRVGMREKMFPAVANIVSNALACFWRVYGQQHACISFEMMEFRSLWVLGASYGSPGLTSWKRRTFRFFSRWRCRFARLSLRATQIAGRQFNKIAHDGLMQGDKGL
jgi:hypothetical protein